MLAVLYKEEEGKEGQRSHKEADHSRGWHGVGLGGKGTEQMLKVSWLYMLSLPMDPTRDATPARTCLLVTMMTSSAMQDISLMVR